MSTVTFKGAAVRTSGELPKLGSKAPGFALTGSDLRELRLADYAGKRKILNIVPSLDTGVCAASTRRFEKEAAGLANTVVLVVSANLPFAQKRFCDVEGIKNVVTLSELRNRDFGKAYGLTMVDGPLAGLLARSVIVLDERDTVLYEELVPEITQEPNYTAALAAAKK